MYDTRWPRPGPAMAVACAAVGLVAGVVLGLVSGGERPAQARVSPESTARADPSLPDDFYTVILVSLPTGQGRAEADVRAQDLRARGVEDVAVLESADYQTLRAGYFVVYSGRFRDDAAAEAHRADLVGRFPDLSRSYVKQARARNP